MDHCGTNGPVHNDQLKKPSGSVRSEYEVSVRIFSDLLDDESTAERMLYVLA
jgi:hypothetical protein